MSNAVSSRVFFFEFGESRTVTSPALGFAAKLMWKMSIPDHDWDLYERMIWLE